MTQTCPACGKSASGRFCANCGAALGKVRCASCDNQLPAGGRFCNMCGTPVPGAAPATPVSAAGGGSGKNLPWLVAGAAVVALAAVLLMTRGGQEETATTPAAAPPFAGAGATGDPTSVDLSSMTPRQAADRLFNRVMENISAGDSVQARTFLPMALNAYDMVPDLDLDGHYHVAVLQLVARDGAAARAHADTILQQAPNHLFGLFTAAQAEILRGNEAEARSLFQRLVDSYDAEVAQGRPEYTEHQATLVPMRDEALTALAR